MHEMSIAEALLDGIREESAKYPGATVRSVRVRIGTLRLVVPEMLDFAFTAATSDTELAGCRLEIETQAAEARCDVCSLQFPVDDNWFECPRCHSARAELIGGNELHLVGLDVELASDKLSSSPACVDNVSPSR